MFKNRILHIALFGLFAIFVASCAKDELEAPSGNEGEIRAIEENSVNDAKDERAIRVHDSEVRNGGGVGINDDGDEEDEGRNPTDK